MSCVCVCLGTASVVRTNFDVESGGFALLEPDMISHNTCAAASSFTATAWAGLLAEKSIEAHGRPLRERSDQGKESA